MLVEVDEINEFIKEFQRHQSNKKLQGSEMSEVGSLCIVLNWLAKKDVLMEGVHDGFLGHNVVVVEYIQNRGG